MEKKMSIKLNQNVMLLSLNQDHGPQEGKLQHGCVLYLHLTKELCVQCMKSPMLTKRYLNLGKGGELNRFQKRNTNNKHTGRGNGQYNEMPPKCPELKTHGTQ